MGILQGCGYPPQVDCDKYADKYAELESVSIYGLSVLIIRRVTNNRQKISIYQRIFGLTDQQW